jgi:hypothetical protein
MRTNTRANTARKFTHEGGRAWPHLKPIAQLRRSVLACLLWEDSFYESGQDIATRIVETAVQVAPAELAALAVEARTRFNLRHAPLLLLEVLSRTGQHDPIVADTTFEVIQRVDELAELLAILWRNGRKMIPHQMQKGMQRAFGKFDEYQFAKYNRDDAIKLRDVLRLVRPKPANEEQSALFKRIKDGALAVPDTWEVSLTRGADKCETFTRLLEEGKLGYLALLRNLRNMEKAGVDGTLIKRCLFERKGARRVLPFRYVAAARAVPQWEKWIDEALVAAISELPPLAGKTIVLVDVSDSMNHQLSGKSDLKRMDAAATLASIINGELRVFTFSSDVKEVPPRRGMAGVDVIKRSQPHRGTYLARAMEAISGAYRDRIIVITDEQSHDGIANPGCDKAYLINVASYQNGVGYGEWTHIDGFSEAVLRYIHEVEQAKADS